RLLDPATGRNLTEPFIHEGPFSAASLRSDGRVAATASQDRTVRIWSAEMRRAEPLTLAVGDAAWEAQWSPSGDRIMSISVNGKHAQMSFWDARTGAALGPPTALDTVAYFAQWAPDASRVATASQTAGLIWDVQTARPLSLPLPHGNNRLLHCA